jgi:hypothetical protein
MAALLQPAHTRLCCRSADRARPPVSAGQGACASTPRTSPERAKRLDHDVHIRASGLLPVQCSAAHCCTRLWHVCSAPSMSEHVIHTPCPSTVPLSAPAFRSSRLPADHWLKEPHLHPQPTCHAACTASWILLILRGWRAWAARLIGAGRAAQSEALCRHVNLPPHQTKRSTTKRDGVA